MTESPSSDRKPVDRRALVRDAVRMSSLLGALACVGLVIAGLPDLAIATAIGTLFGAINFVLLARGVGGAIDRTVAGVERARRELDASDDDPGEGLEPKDVLGRPHGAGGGLRLALLVLLVAALIWYLRIDPAGIAIGIVLTLIGASLAARRHVVG
ncbi:MAG: hypothetical protein R6X02_22480 [Enhygromyxa sp.]